MGDVARAIGATKKGSSSQYATFETKNGDIVTIRLANHNASSARFDNAGRENAISIVVTNRNNEGVLNDGNVYNIAVVNKYGEVEDYVSSVHIKSDNNLRNKITKGAELLLPQERITDGILPRNNPTPTANVTNISEPSKPRFSRKPGESIFDYASRVSEDVERSAREGETKYDFKGEDEAQRPFYVFLFESKEINDKNVATYSLNINDAKYTKPIRFVEISPIRRI